MTQDNRICDLIHRSEFTVVVGVVVVVVVAVIECVYLKRGGNLRQL